MSRPTPTNRRNREVEMREQEQQIIQKKREILQRQHLPKPSSSSSHIAIPQESPKSHVLPFKNDGTFLENFKKLTQAASFIEQQSQQATAKKEGGEEDDTMPTVLSDIIPNTVNELVAMVAAVTGSETVIEERLRSRKKDLPQQMWFLFDLKSPEYRSYRQQVEQARRLAAVVSAQAVAGSSKPGAQLASPPVYGQYLGTRGPCYREEDDDTEDSDTEYRREAKERNLKNITNRLGWHYEDSDSSDSDQHEQPKYEGSRFNQDNFPTHGKQIVVDQDGKPAVAESATSSGTAVNKRKRKSRWDLKANGNSNESSSQATQPPSQQHLPLKRSKVDRSNPELIKLAINSFGSTQLDEEQWAKVEDQFQIKQVYNDLVAKKAEREKLAQNGRYKFEYDSDEEVDGGTWEHKLRKAEMEATRDTAQNLTNVNAGRHHIGDFLPPEELKKFLEQHDKKRKGPLEPVDDYQDKKLTEDNKGFQMLQKLGWKDGEGLGASGSGIVNPINKSAPRDSNQGLGVGSAVSPEEEDNEYDAYRKRMMLAYRFRPNPMNNPRRSYY